MNNCHLEFVLYWKDVIPRVALFGLGFFLGWLVWRTK
jgi:hypothetical protein